MNLEDIIRMAREAGFSEAGSSGDEFFEAGEEDIKRFFQAAYAAGQADEREAMVAEAAKQGLAMKNEDPFEDYVRDIADIRARSQK